MTKLYLCTPQVHNLPRISSTLESACSGAATHPGSVMTFQQQVNSTSQEHRTRFFSSKRHRSAIRRQTCCKGAVLPGSQRRRRAAAAAPLFMVATMATASVEASMAPNSAT